ncbi:helix-turn-helix domain-containing protein [Planobispora longispora]|uniref:helix-turn-helix domain-containing protein n=1 Tax=Planobispora longispora TaxID=28887 RepID=UPI001944C692
MPSRCSPSTSRTRRSPHSRTCGPSRSSPACRTGRRRWRRCGPCARRARSRRAAAAVHLHHSSLAGRVARAEAVLGFSLADPAGRLRAHLALRLALLRSPVRAAPGTASASWPGAGTGVSAAAPGAGRRSARRRPGG